MYIYNIHIDVNKEDADTYMIKISTNNPELLYQQIINEIVNEILHGNLKSGDSLMSIRAFAKEFGISIITVKKAYENLESLGYIFTRPVKGSVISDDAYKIAKSSKIKLIEDNMSNIVDECKNLGMYEQEIEGYLLKIIKTKFGGK